MRTRGLFPLRCWFLFGGIPVDPSAEVGRPIAAPAFAATVVTATSMLDSEVKLMGKLAVYRCLGSASYRGEFWKAVKDGLKFFKKLTSPLGLFDLPTI